MKGWMDGWMDDGWKDGGVKWKDGWTMNKLAKKVLERILLKYNIIKR